MTAKAQRYACSSGKTRYRNRKAALAGIATTRNRWVPTRRSDSLPQLYPYRCQICRGWHMSKLGPMVQDRQEAAS